MGSHLKNIIFANEYRKKPSPDSYYKLNMNNDLKNPIYIGDNKVDRDFANNLNIEFIDVVELI